MPLTAADIDRAAADLESEAAGLQLDAASLTRVARMLRALVADRDRLADRLRDCGYPERDRGRELHG
jgi:hypothetical protein